MQRERARPRGRGLLPAPGLPTWGPPPAGACVAAPYAPPPRITGRRVFETQEMAGMIFAWWGREERAPQWSLPADSLDQDGWSGAEVALGQQRASLLGDDELQLLARFIRRQRAEPELALEFLGRYLQCEVMRDQQHVDRQ